MNKFIKSVLVGTAVLFAANVASAGTIVTDDFSSNKGWSLGTNWEIGSTKVSPNAAGNPDPEQDNTATADNGVLGTILGGNIGGPDGLHGFYYATSPTYNLSNVTKVNVSFYRWLNSDYDPYMTSQVEAFDGKAWQVIFTNANVGSSGYIADNAWTQKFYDVSAFADNNADFRLRFSYDVTSGSVYTISGWNVDDLEISGEVPEPGSLMLIGLGLAAFAARRKAKAA
jgi:large repetitive protein